MAVKSTRSLLSLLPCSQGEEKQVANSLDPSCPPFHTYVSLLMLYDFLELLGIFKLRSINDIKNSNWKLNTNIYTKIILAPFAG